MKSLIAAAGVAAVLTMTACAGAGSADHSSPHLPASAESAVAQPATTSSGDPLELIGLWTIASGGGEDTGARLRIDAGSFELDRGCGFISGDLALSRIGLLMGVSGFSETCWDHVTNPTADWTDRIDGYRITPSGAELLTADAVTATLTPITGDPAFTVGYGLDHAPAIDASTRAFVASPAETHPGLRAASGSDLTGRWVPLGDAVRSENDSVTIDADGTWTAVSSCHSNSGRWLSGRNGQVLATAGSEDLVGCGGSGDSSWLRAARFAGFRHKTLVLQDAAGVEIGRLVRG